MDLSVCQIEAGIAKRPFYTPGHLKERFKNVFNFSTFTDQCDIYIYIYIYILYLSQYAHLGRKNVYRIMNV